MMDAREAIKQAFHTLEHLFPGENFHNLALEEVQLSEDQKHWLITFGFDVKESFNLPVGTNNIEVAIVRKYHILSIDSGTGQFISIRSRDN
jgi:hypothetical protein